MEQGWTDALDGLLAGEDERLVARVHQQGADGGHRADPGRPAPRCARGADRARDHLPLLPSGGRLGERDAPRPHDRHDRDGERQVAVLQPSGAACARVRPARAGALPVPDQGARAGPGAQPHRAAHAGPAPRDLRRRHSAGGAGRDPQARERGAHQPGHAARRDPAPPRRLGRLPRQPGARGGRRGARLSRRVRIARGERAAPPAAARRGLRDQAPLRPHVRDDRQPALARPGADRPGVRPRRARRLRARRARGGDVQPAADRRAHGPPRLQPRRGREPVRGPGRRRGAHDLLRAQPPRGGADLPVRAQAAGGHVRPRGPGRLPTARATRRASAARSSATWPAATCSAW